MKLQRNCFRLILTDKLDQPNFRIQGQARWLERASHICQEAHNPGFRPAILLEQQINN